MPNTDILLGGGVGADFSARTYGAAVLLFRQHLNGTAEMRLPNEAVPVCIGDVQMCLFGDFIPDGFAIAIRWFHLNLVVLYGPVSYVLLMSSCRLHNLSSFSRLCAPTVIFLRFSAVGMLSILCRLKVPED